jgi:hypothetical protein
MTLINGDWYAILVVEMNMAMLGIEFRRGYAARCIFI